MPPTPAITKEEAIVFAQNSLSGHYNGKAPSLEYYVQPSGALALTWVVEIQTDDGNHWFESFIDASSGNVLAANDFVASASYQAVDPRVQDVTQGYEIFTDPADTYSSPNGWHTIGSTSTTDTSGMLGVFDPILLMTPVGNNVISYKGSQSSTTQQSSSGLNFRYTYDTSVSPTSGQNIDAARVNTFFLSNKIHDINYRYGFTEATFNFQSDNFGKGGRGNDRILISVQDSSGTNNANFATPSDGGSGQMR